MGFRGLPRPSRRTASRPGGGFPTQSAPRHWRSSATSSGRNRPPGHCLGNGRTLHAGPGAAQCSTCRGSAAQASSTPRAPDTRALLQIWTFHTGETRTAPAFIPMASLRRKQTHRRLKVRQSPTMGRRDHFRHHRRGLPNVAGLLLASGQSVTHELAGRARPYGWQVARGSLISQWH
jgi:hypothetical protein